MTTPTELIKVLGRARDIHGVDSFANILFLSSFLGYVCDKISAEDLDAMHQQLDAVQARKAAPQQRSDTVPQAAVICDC